MKELWNQRFATEDYFYGIEPNEFFEKELKTLKPGRILLPMEGEGKNAIYAAKLGWEVIAYDYSDIGQQKALRLAKENNVEIEYLLVDNESFKYDGEKFDAIAFIYTHLKSELRRAFFNKLLGFLKPDAEVILEAYSKEQLQLGTGGPPNIDLLYSVDDLKVDFKSLKEVKLEKSIIDITEGDGHNGSSSVIRLRGVV